MEISKNKVRDGKRIPILKVVSGAAYSDGETSVSVTLYAETHFEEEHPLRFSLDMTEAEARDLAARLLEHADFRGNR